ncbi:uncharacterized protein LOC129946276 [Eupeodes corollae]|uniref:uncharacterized protein LOC129946276 n=1 Tax=Eupeodes corollae TaxID=290404 RepID=UPI0024910AEE|nr:uncharacterized protein LOC129946276 [Eupeodes corollae]
MSMGLSMLATVLSLLLAAGILDAAPYQELQPRAGYVPVYIREGETPLSEIHPGLAEAFKEPSYGSNSGIIPASSDESNSNGQTMSEEQGDSLPDLPDEPIIINTSSEEEVNKKIDDIKEPKVNVAEAAKEAIKEIVSVFESEMLEKLGLSENNEQSSSKSEDKREVQNTKPLEETIGNDESKSSSAKVADKTLEKLSDVLTVEAFKAKDFNKESNQDDGIDVPEDVPLDQ